MEFWEEWLLIEGFIKQQEEAQNDSGDYYQDDDYDTGRSGFIGEGRKVPSFSSF